MNVATSMNVFFDPTFKLTAREQLEKVNAAGFKYVDINFWDWGHSPDSPFMKDDYTEWVKEIKDCGESLGLIFHQAHAMVYNPFVDSQSKEWGIEATKRSLIGAGMLGIDWVVFHPHDLSGRDYESADISLEMHLQKNVEWLKPYVKLAEDNNTGIALENMNDYGKNLRYCYNAAQLCTLVDALDSENVGVCWDIGHAHCQKIDQYDEIMSLGSRLKVLHVQDNNGLHDGHTAPYYGTINWNKVRKALDDVKYQGEFTFEAHMIVRMAPDDKSKDIALKLLHAIGEHIVSMDV